MTYAEQLREWNAERLEILAELYEDMQENEINEEEL